MAILLVVLLICISVTVFVALVSTAAFYGGTAIGKKVIERLKWMFGVDDKKGGDR